MNGGPKTGTNSEELRKIVEEVDELKEKFRSLDKANEIAEQWKQLSRVLDRFFFVVFFLLLLVISTIILAVIPLMKAPVDLAGELLV